jgi:WD40 repeat protein
LVFGGWNDDFVRVWDVIAGKQLIALKPTGSNWTATSVAISPKGDWIAAAIGENNAICVWNLAAGQLVHTLTGHSEAINSMTFDFDGNWLLTGSGELNTDYSGRIGLAQSGQVRLWHLASETVTVLGQQSRAVLDVDISTDGQLVAAGQTDGIVNVWNTGNGELPHEFYTHADVAWGMEICCTRDSKRLAACTDDQAVKVWEVITGKEEQIYHDHRSNITTLAFSPDGKRLASGSRDHTVKLWEATGGQIGHATMQALYANTQQLAAVTSVMFAHADHRVFSFGASGLTAWDSLRMQQLYQIEPGDS